MSLLLYVEISELFGEPIKPISIVSLPFVYEESQIPY